MQKKDDQPSVQQIFLNQLKSVLPDSTSLAAELSDLLEISSDSAYRRIRGQTPLSLEEAHKLSITYNISLGGLSDEALSLVQFSYAKMNKELDSMKGYFQRLLDNLRIINKGENAQLWYCSQDIPIFHNIRFSSLSKFKIFYWMRSILNADDISIDRFDRDSIPEEVIELGQAVYKEYSKLDCAELWSPSTMNSTLRQIQYYWESGLFASPELALEVIHDLQNLMKELEQIATRGWKDVINEKGKYDLYISEIELTTNCALVNVNNRKGVFLGHHTFNMLQTNHADYSEQTEVWFQNMMRRATLISSVGEKNRYQFFQAAHQKIAALEKEMQAQLQPE